MTFNRPDNTKAVAYNIASHVISTFGNNSECTARKAFSQGRYELEIDTWPTILFGSLLGGSPVFLIVTILCVSCKIGMLGTFICNVGLGGIPFLIVLCSFLSENRAKRYDMALVNNLVHALNHLEDREREGVFLFLRHQGVISQRLQAAYNTGFDDGSWDGDLLNN